jgi:glycogen(starch) synthase
VLSDIDSLRELWDGAAFFVASDDREQLRDALVQICGNEVLRTRLQRAAAARARRYTVDRMVSGYLNLYEAVLAPHGEFATAGQEAFA